MADGRALGLLALVLLVECLVLRWGQRRLLALALGVVRRRWIAYALAAPGTVLHELAHLVMCRLLLVPTGRVELFRPRSRRDGSVQLGAVSHARVDPVRGALVAIAPVLLVPALVLGATLALLGTDVLRDPWPVVQRADGWRVAACAALAASVGQAAFPSSGDRVGVLGGVALLVVAGLLAWIAAASDRLPEVLQLCAAALAVPALAVVVLGVLLRGLARR